MPDQCVPMFGSDEMGDCRPIHFNSSAGMEPNARSKCVKDWLIRRGWFASVKPGNELAIRQRACNQATSLHPDKTLFDTG